MSLLKLQDPSQAQGKTKEIYSLFDQLGWVPKPFLLFSPSEHLLDIRAQIVKRRGAHPSLSRGFFALLRMILAEDLGYTYCVSFNADLLKAWVSPTMTSSGPCWPIRPPRPCPRRKRACYSS